MFLFVCVCCGLMASSLAAAVDVEQFSGCRAIRSPCCEGKNNTCIGEGPRLNDIDSTSCFCDTACIELGDCCLDYADTCPVFDCELSEDWGEWSDCDVRCGTGTKTRSRIVLKSAQNGGKPCESHVQKTSCEGAKCKQARAGEGHNELKERGRIIPAVFGSWRNNKKYDPFQDIRKNLFEHYGHPGLVERPPYCAKFEIIDIHGACKTAKMSSKWSKNLSRGATLCMECQTFSMKKELGGRCRGHGVYNKVTEWKAVTVPGCHGKWKMTSRHEDGCQCDPNSDLSFVLV